MVRSLGYLDDWAYHFGGVGRWCWGRYEALRTRGRGQKSVDLIPDWEARLAG